MARYGTEALTEMLWKTESLRDLNRHFVSFGHRNILYVSEGNANKANKMLDYQRW